MNNFPIILAGSGNSVPFLNSRYNHNGFKNGLDPKLESVIKGNYSIGLNNFFQYGCDTTFTSFVDASFYEDNYKALSALPLIIGKLSPELKRHEHDITHPNTMLFKKSNRYNGKESFSKGIYSTQLVGLFALSIAITLGFKEIYLLGYDGCEVNGQTHFYQGVIDLNKKIDLMVNKKKVGDREVWRGIGKKQTKKGERFKTSTYNKPDNLNKIWFKPFKDLKDIKIYNVSSKSKIELFEKIDYDAFYSKVTNNYIDQNKAREDFKNIIEKLK